MLVKFTHENGREITHEIKEKFRPVVDTFIAKHECAMLACGECPLYRIPSSGHGNCGDVVFANIESIEILEPPKLSKETNGILPDFETWRVRHIEKVLHNTEENLIDDTKEYLTGNLLAYRSAFKGAIKAYNTKMLPLLEHIVEWNECECTDKPWQDTPGEDKICPKCFCESLLKEIKAIK